MFLSKVNFLDCAIQYLHTCDDVTILHHICSLPFVCWFIDYNVKNDKMRLVTTTVQLPYYGKQEKTLSTTR